MLSRIATAIKGGAQISRPLLSRAVAITSLRHSSLFPQHEKHAKFQGRLLMVGFGSIGMGTLPLLLRHIDLDPSRITILTPADRENQAAEAAARYGVNTVIASLDQHNYQEHLEQQLGPGDLLLNLSVDVSSIALMRWCAARDALYLDTVIEPWAGGYTDTSLTPSKRSNYAQREEALGLKRVLGEDSATAVITHGANPGLVNHFVKRGLLDIARDNGLDLIVPTTREKWAKLAKQLGIKVIHIAERDTQVASSPKQVGEFVNTWSVEGFVGEGMQPAELGFGTHEKFLPSDGHRHSFSNDSAIYLNRPGASTRVRSWTPTEGAYHGFLITHNESISLSDYFSIAEDGQVVYRPTVHYAYHPCDDAVLSMHEFAGKNWAMQPRSRLLVDEITDGIDELGVLLAGNSKGAYWIGSQLSIHDARSLVEYNSATSLQVTASAMAGVVWAINNPRRGIVEPEEMDHDYILDITRAYVEPVVGEYTDWTPLQDRGVYFDEDLDREDPWQFKNIRVN